MWSPGETQKRPRYARSDKYKRHKAQYGESRSKNDLDIYLQEEALDVEKEDDFNILKWWEVRQCRLSILSLLARDILSTPISTVPSESVFSTGGRLLDSFRSSLTPKIVEALICAQDWLKVLK